MSNKRAIWETLLALPGPKVTCYGRRIHHGAAGVLIALTAPLLPSRFTIARQAVFALGVLLALHDVRDRSDWFRGRWT